MLHVAEKLVKRSIDNMKFLVTNFKYYEAMQYNIDYKI
jgi:hypothetical protein